MRSNDGTVEIPLPPAESVCVRGSISRRRQRRRRAHRRFHCGHVPYQKTASAVSPPRKRRTNRLKAIRVLVSQARRLSRHRRGGSGLGPISAVIASYQRAAKRFARCIRSGARPQPGGCDATSAARGVRRAGPATGGADGPWPNFLRLLYHKALAIGNGFRFCFWFLLRPACSANRLLGFFRAGLTPMF